MIGDIVVFIAVMSVMVSASVQDLRRREVSDVHWIAIGTIGIVVSSISGDAVGGVLRAAGSAVMLLYVFSDRIPFLASVPIVCILMLASFVVSSDPSGIVTAATSLVLILMYRIGVIRGGADAKALVSLSMVYPLYPDLGCMIWPPSYPAGYVLNPVFSILFEGLIFSMLLTVPVFFRNLKEGNVSFSAYRLEIGKARGSFVWPLEDVSGGDVVRIRPTDDPGIYGRLEDIGRKDVLVTPMVPFIPPLTAALLSTIMMGCPLFAFI